jgi:hypothetical protein
MNSLVDAASLALIEQRTAVLFQYAHTPDVTEPAPSKQKPRLYQMKRTDMQVKTSQQVLYCATLN